MGPGVYDPGATQCRGPPGGRAKGGIPPLISPRGAFPTPGKKTLKNLGPHMG